MHHGRRRARWAPAPVAAVLVALVAGLAVAGPAALRLVSPSGRPLSPTWQHWARASLMPTVTGRVTVRFSGCPALPKAAGCVYNRRPRLIYLSPHVRDIRSVFLHELGHLFDLRVMNNRDRGRFRGIFHQPLARGWWTGKIPLAEQFAEAYSFCARYQRIVSIARYSSYSYRPSHSQHRAVCALIRDAGRDRAPAAPPPNLPAVTRSDPAPPPQPPPGANTVPNGGAPAPAPNPTPTPTPKPGPIPTPPPLPVPAPTPPHLP